MSEQNIRLGAAVANLNFEPAAKPTTAATRLRKLLFITFIHRLNSRSLCEQQMLLCGKRISWC